MGRVEEDSSSTYDYPAPESDPQQYPQESSIPTYATPTLEQPPPAESDPQPPHYTQFEEPVPPPPPQPNYATPPQQQQPFQQQQQPYPPPQNPQPYPPPQPVQFPPQQKNFNTTTTTTANPQQQYYPPQSPYQGQQNFNKAQQYPPQSPYQGQKYPPQQYNQQNGQQQFAPMPANGIPMQAPPMSQVPVALANVGTQPWTTGLLDFMEDPGNALTTFFFPCITFGQIAEVIDNGHTSCGTSGIMYAGILVLIAMPCLLSCGYRSRLRVKYGLIESPADDWMVHFLCEYCALCQEYRELKNRDLDPSLVPPPPPQPNYATPPQQQQPFQQQQQPYPPPQNPQPYPPPQPVQFSPQQKNFNTTTTTTTANPQQQYYPPQSPYQGQQNFNKAQQYPPQSPYQGQQYPPQQYNQQNGQQQFATMPANGIPMQAPPMSPVPVALANVGTQPWTTGLLDFMEDPGNALTTFFFPCITFGQIAEVIDNGHTSCGTSGIMYAGILVLIAMPCLLSCGYRSRLRVKYGLIESPADDWMVHFLCEYCALCQEYRELKNRGLDSSLGWQGNLAQQQNMQNGAMMAPPANQTMMV
ncbi:Protein PLANT CADMIUM RESISTANCE 6 [Acorus calamus]|uniref:Protein PLANT CADMIUM RESISTANCE 6 n=1 Tax=Acorus calamus TaxID=4465 RepID=A0AAV9E5C5_ACOCL|nr:Protein PLANT CADMIUM RESISTANCE 6 [Acorus calamus]